MAKPQFPSSWQSQPPFAPVLLNYFNERAEDWSTATNGAVFARMLPHMFNELEAEFQDAMRELALDGDRLKLGVIVIPETVSVDYQYSSVDVDARLHLYHPLEVFVPTREDLYPQLLPSEHLHYVRDTAMALMGIAWQTNVLHLRNLDTKAEMGGGKIIYVHRAQLRIPRHHLENPGKYGG